MEKDIVTNPIMWTPSDERIKSSQMFRFIQNINEKLYSYFQNQFNDNSIDIYYQVLKIKKKGLK